MMVSNASEPQIRVRIDAEVGRERAKCSAAKTRPHPLAAARARVID
jgi:hypothetical protein